VSYPERVQTKKKWQEGATSSLFSKKGPVAKRGGHLPRGKQTTENGERQKRQGFGKGEDLTYRGTRGGKCGTYGASREQ